MNPSMKINPINLRKMNLGNPSTIIVIKICQLREQLNIGKPEYICHALDHFQIVWNYRIK